MMTVQAQIVCVILAILTSVTSTAVVKNKTVYLLALLPYPADSPFNPSWRDGPAISLALDMAQDQINNQTELLPDYHIELIHDDSGCEFTTKAYEALVRNVYHNNKKVVGIIGPGCSRSSLAVASLTSRKKIVTVTVHSGASSLLTNRTAYPYALSSLGSSDLFAEVAVRLMEKNSWTRVGVLFDSVRFYYISSFESLRNSEIGNGSIAFASAVFDTNIPLTSIVKLGLRINFILTPVSLTQRILCLAMHRQMVYPAYQWIVASNYFEEVAQEVTFAYESEQYTCSKEQMIRMALNGTSFINFQLFQLNDNVSSTHSMYSFKDYNQTIYNRIYKYNSIGIELNRSNISYSVWTTYFYDSLWAWSVALDSLTRKNPSLDLTKIEYCDTAFSDSLMEEFYSLDFEGVSGRIKFLNDSGSVTRAVAVNQVRCGRDQMVAFFDEEKNYKQSPSFQNIPDSFDHQTVNEVIIGIFFFITSLQLVSLLILHALTFKYKKNPSVKATSLKLQYFFYVGCYTFSFALMLLAVSELDSLDGDVGDFLCNLIWPWLLPFSFSITFGVVAVRTWRLYRIFIHYLDPGWYIGNYYLICCVVVLLLVDIVVGTVFTAVDPQKLRYEFYPDLKGGVVFQVRIRQCVRNNSYVFYGIILSLRGALLIVVFVLTMLTRKIKSKNFTTKTFRVLVYLLCIVMVVGFVTFTFTWFLNPLSSLSFVSQEITFNLILFLFIVLVCLPPLCPVLRDLLTQCSAKKKPMFGCKGHCL